MQDVVILDYSERLLSLEKEHKEIVSGAVAAKTRAAKLEEELCTLRENYEGQISELSQKLIDLMTRKANEHNPR